ncbi:MAG: hypothetical protein LKM43_02400 [Wolbachia endosymbiont of Penenirmus auritus]|nr:hypothetical protein [Wolbachia endosymbiont of Penenirmus auritus]
MSNVKDIFKLEKGEPFYIGGEEYYKIKLVSKDQQDKQISFSYPYIFAHRLDNEGENLYIASESDGKIIKRHLPFHNNKEYSLKDFQSKMKLQELPRHFINVKVIEHEGKHKFALYDKVVSSSEDTEKFITILPLSSFSHFNRNFNISEYKDEELRLTLKKSTYDDYGKIYAPIIIKESDQSEICELRNCDIFFYKDGTLYAFEPKTNQDSNDYYWWNKHSYGDFRYVTLIDDGDSNYRLQLSNEDGTKLEHESTPCYNEFLNKAFQELISYLFDRLELTLFLSDNQIQTLVDHLTNHQLKTLAQELNEARLKVIVPILNEDQLGSLVKELEPDQVKNILPHLKTNQFKVLIKTLNDDQFTELVKDLAEHHLTILSKELEDDQLKTLVNKLEKDKLKDLVNKLDHHKLEIIAQDLTDPSRIKVIIDSLIDPKKLQILAHNISDEQFAELLNSLDAEELKDIIHKLPYEKVISVVGQSGDKSQLDHIVRILEEKLEEQKNYIKNLLGDDGSIVDPNNPNEFSYLYYHPVVEI